MPNAVANNKPIMDFHDICWLIKESHARRCSQTSSRHAIVNIAYIRMNTAEFIAPIPSPQKATVISANALECNISPTILYRRMDESSKNRIFGIMPIHLENVPVIEESVCITK